MSISNAQPCVDDEKHDYGTKLFEEAKSIQQNSRHLPFAQRRTAMEKVSSLEAEAVRWFQECEAFESNEPNAAK